MKRTRTEMKAALQAKAREAIDRLVDWHKETEEPTLTQIEDMVLELRQELGEQMTKMIIEDQEAVHPVPGPACPKCGKEMHYKGMKGTTVRTRSGKIEQERAYYYCEDCKGGLFPPGSTTEAEDKTLE